MVRINVDAMIEERLNAGAGTFGDAIEALKAGHRVQRAGWNGKGMWIALTEASTVNARSMAGPPGHLRGAARKLAETEPDRDSMIIGAHIDMRAADGCLVIGWLASQTDMLAADWRVLP